MKTTPENDARYDILRAKTVRRKHRVVIRGTSGIARRENGTPVDKGGRDFRRHAASQAYAITKENEQAGRIQPPCR